MKRVSAIIVAAGEGRRFGSSKQFACLRGKSVLDWCLERFEAHKQVTEVVLVLKDEGQGKKYLEQYSKIVAVARGGARRQDSVYSGFYSLDPEKAEVVLVHDAARPIIEEELISRVIEATLKREAVIPAVPVEDTIKLVEGEEVRQTVNREKLFRIQTPQGFYYPVLKQALDKARDEKFYGTDEASLVEKTGRKVFTVQGDPRNIKITTLEDLKIAEALLED